MSLIKLNETQPIAVQTIRNAFNKSRVAHAYLLEGARGTGKLEVAKMIAKMHFCIDSSTVEPCDECSNCKRIESGNHPDLFVVEPDGLSIKKEQIQALQKEFSFSGFEGNKKIYILKHADKMSPSAANSLLKFLEEPNPETIAILITEEVHRMLNTILSRCQILSFNPLPHSLYVQQLINECSINPNDARLIASLTNSVDEAAAMYQDEKFHVSKKLIITFGQEIQSGNANAFISISSVLGHFNAKDKVEVELAFELLVLFFKDFLYAKIGKLDKLVFAEHSLYFVEESQRLLPTIITKNISTITNARNRIYSNVPPQLILEQIIIDIRRNLE